MRLLDRLFRRPARAPGHRATGPSTYQQIQALSLAATTHMPRTPDGPVLLTPAQAHQRATTYRSASMPTPDERMRAAALDEVDTRPMGRAEMRDALDGGDRGELVRPYTVRHA
jgi:hypothetical protein